MTNIDEITVTFCEALRDDQLPLTFFSYGDFNTFVASITPPKLGYYKTYFVISSRGTPIFQGRYDIDDQTRSKFHPLEEFLHGTLNHAFRAGRISDQTFKAQIATLDLDTFQRINERKKAS